MYIPHFKSVCRIRHGEKIFKKSKTRKNNRQNSQNIIFQKTSHPCTKLDGFILTYEDMIEKNWVWPTFVCKVGQSDPNAMKLKNRHLVPPTVWIYQVSNWYLKACLRKSGKLGRMDGQTDGYCHGIIQPFFKRGYINMPQMIFRFLAVSHLVFHLQMVYGSLSTNLDT